MATDKEGKDTEGRKYEQLTRDGTSSAGTMGTGATGDAGDMQGGQPGSAGRTDDLLAGGAGADPASPGFAGGGRTAELQTGMGGIGSLAKGTAGNQQREGAQQPGGDTGPMRSAQAQQGAASVPESGGQRIDQKGGRDS